MLLIKQCQFKRCAIPSQDDAYHEWEYNETNVARRENTKREPSRRLVYRVFWVFPVLCSYNSIIIYMLLSSLIVLITLISFVYRIGWQQACYVLLYMPCNGMLVKLNLRIRSIISTSASSPGPILVHKPLVVYMGAFHFKALKICWQHQNISCLVFIFYIYTGVYLVYFLIF